MTNEAIVDACCFINLSATGDLRGFLAASEWSWHIPKEALAESLYIRVVNDAGEDDREAIDPQACFDEGLLTLIDVQDAEAELYVRLARDLDDGEAMALAVARHRGWMLATDDRKAKRLANRHGVVVVTTPELVQRWAEREKMTRSRIRALLHAIEFGARFTPAEDAPGYDWWTTQVGR